MQVWGQAQAQVLAAAQAAQLVPQARRPERSATSAAPTEPHMTVVLRTVAKSVRQAARWSSAAQRQPPDWRSRQSGRAGIVLQAA